MGGSWRYLRGLTTDGLTGYSYTNTLQGYGQGAHPAAYAAWNYKPVNDSASIPSGGSTPAHWFLPTKQQLSNIVSALGGYSTFKTKVGWSSAPYWSSTEFDADYAWYLLSDGNWFRAEYYESTNQLFLGAKDYYDISYNRTYMRACFAY